MRNLEMRLRRDGAEWCVYPLSKSGCWLACWDRWRPTGGGLLATCALELSWDEAVLMVGQVVAMDDATFQSWHAQALASWASTMGDTQSIAPSKGTTARRRFSERVRRLT